MQAKHLHKVPVSGSAAVIDYLPVHYHQPVACNKIHKAHSVSGILCCEIQIYLASCLMGRKHILNLHTATLKICVQPMSHGSQTHFELAYSSLENMCTTKHEATHTDNNLFFLNKKIMHFCS